jgi:hypothetical protein
MAIFFAGNIANLARIEQAKLCPTSQQGIPGRTTVTV